MSASRKDLATATVELVRDTSRRLSADLRDMGRDVRQVGNRIRNSSTSRLDVPLPRITLPSYPSSDNFRVPQNEDLDSLLDDDDEVGLWSSQPRSSVSSSPGFSRSPKTEEILKNIEEVLRKTDQVLRDVMGLECKSANPGASGGLHPSSGKIVAPPPSPANYMKKSTHF